jgi:hypothetical protein
MSFWRHFTISHVHALPSLHISIPDDYVSTEIVLHSSAQSVANTYNETCKLWYDKQPAPLRPDVMLYDANKIVHPLHDSLSVLYGPLIIHVLPS